MPVAYNGTLQRLPESVHGLYAELLDRAMVLDAELASDEVRGAFVSKTIKGRKYWYVQERAVNGVRRQRYLGPESPTLVRWMEDAGKNRNLARDAAATNHRLVAMLRAGGARVERPLMARVVGALADAGVFRGGAVLVGSVAFGTYGNMLGVKLEEAMSRTEDVDVAKELEVDVAVGQDLALDVRAALTSSGVGEFHEIPELDSRQPSTSFALRRGQLRVDFLTPLVGRPRSQPVVLRGMGVAAQPVRFLDYLLGDTQPAVLLNGHGVLVHVPSPARFALHKLVVAQKRIAAFQAKAAKDLMQAQALLAVLLADRPGDLLVAWDALVARRDSAKALAEKSMRKLDEKAWGALGAHLGVDTGFRGATKSSRR
jgi:hypothetical protein